MDNCNRVNSYNPSYIVSQDATKYGGNQSDYLAKAEKAIVAAADKISACRKKGGDLKALFFEVIKDLSLQRSEIARVNRTNEWEAFGKRRDVYYPGMCSTLILGKIYQAYNEKILKLLAGYLKQMESKEEPGQFAKEMLIKDSCDGKQWTLKIEVLNLKDLDEKNYTLNPPQFFPDYILNKKFLEGFDKWTDEDIHEYRQKFRRFKNESPENFRAWRQSCAVTNLFGKCPSPSALGLTEQQVWTKFSPEQAQEIIGNMKSLYVVSTLRMELEPNKLYPLTQYFTWMYENKDWYYEKNPDHHPIKRMQERSKVMLFHQDEFLMDTTLQEISKIFEKCVTWNSRTETTQALKDRMALLTYLATHNIRDVRGTAAENEWLECAIYRSLGVDYSIEREKGMVDLEAFANPLFSKFKEVYSKMVNISEELPPLERE